MNTKSTWLSLIGHFAAGLIVVAFPILLTGVPLEWQTLTVGGLLAAVLKWAHLYSNL